MKAKMIFFWIFLVWTSCQKKQANQEKEHDHGTVAEYTCPMHPEIIQDKPGECPICGMDLVKKESLAKNKEQTDDRHSKEEVAIYTCPMHPEIIRDKPGKCPICEMDLVKKESGNTASTDSLENVLQPVNQSVLSSAKAIVPIYKDLNDPINVEGYITYDSREILNIASRINGRIEKLFVKYAYQPVNKGDKLFDLYSPEALNDSYQYIYLLKNDPSNTLLITKAKEKLILQGLTNEQINYMKKKGEPDHLIRVYSPESGHVHDPTNLNRTELMDPNENPSDFFNLKEGMYVETGKTILSLLATHKVWGIVKVPNQFASKIKLGQKVYIQHEANGKLLESNISFIYPYYQSNSTSLQFRVDITNHHHAFRIGEFISVKIPFDEKKVLAIPRQAVLKLGKESIVFVKKSGMYTATQVDVGSISNGYYPITNGISSGDSIALNAGYLVDSESFIRPKTHE